MHYILSIIYVLFLSINCSDFSLAIDDDSLNLEQKFSKNIYEFRDPSLFIKVFSHPGIDPSNNSFGVLELLGDKILGFVITDHLWCLNPGQDEGWISKTLSEMVSNEHNAIIANNFKLLDYIKINPIHKDKKDGVQKILADTCEALIGAIYKDKGIDVAKKFILENWFKKPENMSQKKEPKYYLSVNGSSQSLELYRVTHKFLPSPHFKVIQNQPMVCVQVFYGKEALPEIFKAKTKREAKDLAAHGILEALEKNNFSEIIKSKPKEEILQIFYEIIGVDNFKVNNPPKKEERLEEMDKPSTSIGESSDNIKVVSSSSRQSYAASSEEPNPKRFNKADFPNVISLDDSQRKLTELCNALGKGVLDYRTIQDKKKSATVTVNKYGFQEAKGNDAQKIAAKEMYKKITGEMISLKKAKQALEEVCKQKNLGNPFYTSDPDSSFVVHVFVGNSLIPIGASCSFKSLENAKKLAAQDSYTRLLREISYLFYI